MLMRRNFVDLEAAFRLILTRTIDGRDGTLHELNEAYQLVLPHLGLLATRIFRRAGIRNAAIEADEVIQNWYILTCSGHKSFDSLRPAKAYTEGIVSTLCRAHCRRKRKVVSLPVDFEAVREERSPIDNAMIEEARDFVREAMTRLAEIERHALFDQFFSEWTAAESAAKRDRTISATNRARSRARKALKIASIEFGIDDWP